MLGSQHSNETENAQKEQNKLGEQETVKTQLLQVSYYLRKEHGEFGIATRLEQITDKVFGRNSCLDISQA